MRAADESARDGDAASHAAGEFGRKLIERVFQLADFVVVKNASLENGLLHVDLVREIPEAKKPRQIAIGSATPSAQVASGSTEPDSWDAMTTVAPPAAASATA